jgi:hypothetical protein
MSLLGQIVAEPGYFHCRLAQAAHLHILVHASVLSLCLAGRTGPLLYPDLAGGRPCGRQPPHDIAKTGVNTLS